MERRQGPVVRRRCGPSGSSRCATTTWRATRFRHTAQFNRWRPDRDPRVVHLRAARAPLTFAARRHRPRPRRGLVAVFAQRRKSDPSASMAPAMAKPRGGVSGPAAMFVRASGPTVSGERVRQYSSSRSSLTSRCSSRVRPRRGPAPARARAMPPPVALHLDFGLAAHDDLGHFGDTRLAGPGKAALGGDHHGGHLRLGERAARSGSNPLPPVIHCHRWHWADPLATRRATTSGKSAAPGRSPRP